MLHEPKNGSNTPIVQSSISEFTARMTRQNANRSLTSSNTRYLAEASGIGPSSRNPRFITSNIRPNTSGRRQGINALTSSRPSAGRPGTSAGIKSRLGQQKEKSQPKNHKSFIKERDYTGLRTILEFESRINTPDAETEAQNLLWRAFCSYQLKDFESARDLLKKLSNKETKWANYVNIFLACTLYRMGNLEEAHTITESVSANHLQERLLCHIAQKNLKRISSTSTLNKAEVSSIESRTLQETFRRLQSQLSASRNSPANRISLAASYFNELQFHKALEQCQQVLALDQSLSCVYVYMAMCLFHMEDYERSLAALERYFEANAENLASLCACNLRACNFYKLSRSVNALAHYESLGDWVRSAATDDYEMLLHNTAIIADNKNLLIIFTQLADAFPEAKRNLVIYHLQGNDAERYNDVLQILDNAKNPGMPRDNILKCIVHLCLGQHPHDDCFYHDCGTSRGEHLKLAEEGFLAAGTDASMENTVSGRQALACHYFLKKQFTAAIEIFATLKCEHANKDHLKWNFGIALASEGRFPEAREILQGVENELLRSDIVFLFWLCRCHIFCNYAAQALDLYQRYYDVTYKDDMIELLYMIANEAYIMQDYGVSLTAFIQLEQEDQEGKKLENSQKAKRGACVGIFGACLDAWYMSDDRKNDFRLIRCINQLKEAIRSLAQEGSDEKDKQLGSIFLEWTDENGILFDLDGYNNE